MHLNPSRSHLLKPRKMPWERSYKWTPQNCVSHLDFSEMQLQPNFKIDVPKQIRADSTWGLAPHPLFVPLPPSNRPLEPSNRGPNPSCLRFPLFVPFIDIEPSTPSKSIRRNRSKIDPFSCSFVCLFEHMWR